MPWVRFDDQFPIHRKVSGLSDAEYRLHTEAIFWCARNLTDGCIARDELRVVSGISKPDRHVTALVSRGLWVDTDDGWRINDYLTYQPSRSKVLTDRAAKAEAGRMGGIRSGESRRSKSEAKPKQSASRSVQHPNPPSSSKKGEGRAGDTLRAVPPWCQRCHPDTRMFVTDDDSYIPCPTCHPNSGAA